MTSHYDRRYSGRTKVSVSEQRLQTQLYIKCNTLGIDTTNARLPSSYVAAKTALLECTRVDECLAWANKAYALASYAKQARDESLKNMALRIQARAVQRCGELLRAVKPQSGKRTDRDVGGAPTRMEVAHSAGMSRGQMRAAIQVASVPKEQFEYLVEGDMPPTITKLSQHGVRSQGRIPDAIREAMHALRHFAHTTRQVDAIVAAQYLRGHQSYLITEELIPEIREWLRQLEAAIKGDKNAS
jgi:hypothetical protein